MKDLRCEYLKIQADANMLGAKEGVAGSLLNTLILIELRGISRELTEIKTLLKDSLSPGDRP